MFFIYSLRMIPFFSCHQMNKNLVDIVRIFSLAPGLKVNMEKSSVVGINATRNKIENFTRWLWCEVSE